MGYLILIIGASLIIILLLIIEIKILNGVIKYNEKIEKKLYHKNDEKDD